MGECQHAKHVVDIFSGLTCPLTNLFHFFQDTHMRMPMGTIRSRHGLCSKSWFLLALGTPRRQGVM